MEFLLKPLIRPIRSFYSSEDLGPTSFRISSFYIDRQDFPLICPHGFTMQCSLFEPIFGNNETCIIYIHGNSSSRIEGISLIPFIAKLGYPFFVFDFPGCGLSEGKFVSMGYYEKEDVDKIITYLMKTKNYKNFVLWGRSMGASVALMLTENKKDRIKCVIADSPFLELKMLCKEIAGKQLKILTLFFEFAWEKIKGEILRIHGYDIDKINILGQIKKSCTPVLIICSKEDELIGKHHGEKIFREYKGEKKEILFIKGKHNEIRENDVLDKCIGFVKKFLRE